MRFTFSLLEGQHDVLPRSARLDAPGVLRHVMGRGMEGRKIFLNNDRDDFIARLKHLVDDQSMIVYACALVEI